MPVRRARDDRRRDDGDRARREPAAQGPHRRSKRRTACSTLAEAYGYTHEKMAEKLGKSRTSITETLSLDHHAGGRPRAVSAGRHSVKSLLLQIVRQSDPEKWSPCSSACSRRSDPERRAAFAKEAKARPRRGAPRPLCSASSPRRRASACRSSSGRERYSRGDREDAGRGRGRARSKLDFRSQAK